MSNHYHLVVETVEGNLAPEIRQLNGVHTQASNRPRGRGGHLFQGRFTGILVDRAAYLLELIRYVVLTRRRRRWSMRRSNGPGAAIGRGQLNGDPIAL
jgi:putative transposase